MAKGSLSDAFKAAGITAVTGMAGNSAIYFVADLLHGWDGVIATQPGQPIEIWAAVLSSIVGTVLATIIFLAIRAATENYQKIFTWVVVIGTAITFYSPLTGLTNPTTTAVVALELMHVWLGFSIWKWFSKA